MGKCLGGANASVPRGSSARPPLPQRKVDWGGRPAGGLPAIVPSPVSPSPSRPQPPLDSGFDLGHSPEVASGPGEERKAVSSFQQGKRRGRKDGQASPSRLRWGYGAAGIGPSRISLSPGCSDAAPPKQLRKALLKLYQLSLGAHAKANQVFLEAGPRWGVGWKEIG